MSRRTGRFLFCLRSKTVPTGGTWSLWGGKAEEGESPIETARRELWEETGYQTEESLIHIHRLSNRGFIYNTFIIVVEDEFCPRTSRESSGFAWCPIEDVPTPMHWGLERLFEDRDAVARIVRFVEGTSGRDCPLRPSRSRSPGQSRARGKWRH